VLYFSLGPEEYDEYLITTLPEGGDEPGVAYSHGLRLRGTGSVSRVHVTTESRPADTAPEVDGPKRDPVPEAPGTPDPSKGAEARDATGRSQGDPSA
jgi:hypothetical protein